MPSPLQIRQRAFAQSLRLLSTVGIHLPWYAPGAIRMIRRHLRHQAAPRIWEWGAGRSTRWYADLGTTISVDDDSRWCVWASRNGAEVRHVADLEAYIHAIDAEPDDSFDVVAVDGRKRLPCLRQAIRKVRPGGLLVLDDVHREQYASAQTEVPWPTKRFDFGGHKTQVWTRPA